MTRPPSPPIWCSDGLGQPSAAKHAAEVKGVATGYNRVATALCVIYNASMRAKSWNPFLVSGRDINVTGLVALMVLLRQRHLSLPLIRNLACRKYQLPCMSFLI